MAVIGTRSFIAEYVPLIAPAEIVVAAPDADVPPATALIVLARTTATADVAKPLILFIYSPKFERSRISQRATYHIIARISLLG
jgi:hypothetical protein